MSSWKEIATSERLLDGLSDEQIEMLSRVFSLLPDDTSRVLFLRYANEAGILASSPHMTGILLMLAFTARMAATEIESAGARTAAVNEQNAMLVQRVEEAIRQVGEAAIQIVDRTTHLRGYTEAVATKMDAIANSLPQRFEEVIRTFDTILQKAAEAKVQAAQEASFETAVKPKVAKVIADIDVVSKDVALIAERLLPIAQQAKIVIASEPFIVGGIKVNRQAGILASATLAIGLVLGGILGLSVSKPAPVTLTPAMVHTFDQGAAYAKIWPYLTPRQQAAIARGLAQPNATP